MHPHTVPSSGPVSVRPGPNSVAAKTLRLQRLRQSMGIFARARAEGMTLWEIVCAVHAAFPDEPLLRVHRYIRGWELKDAAEAITAEAVRRSTGKKLKMTSQRLCHLESGEQRPSLFYLDVLSRVYETRPDRLGLVEDHTPVDERPPAPECPKWVGPALAELAYLGSDDLFVGRI